jgi:hypothetical protein
MCLQDVLNDVQWWDLVFRDKLSDDLRAQGKKDQKGGKWLNGTYKEGSVLRAI